MSGDARHVADPWPWLTLDAAERFWDRVRVGGDIFDCWLWMRARDNRGYGRLNHDGRMERAHRVAWTLRHGPIPDGLLVLHECDNPPCCNPAHLFLGTDADNMRDMVRKGRQARGERTGGRKLSDAQAIEIRRRFVPGASVRLAAEFGVSPRQIYYVASGYSWSHL